MSVNKVNTDGTLSPIAGGTLYADSPIASILPYGGTSAPIGWLICDGSAVSRLQYAELFAVIGTSFGIGDGSTTFNIPDLREATVKGTGVSGKSNNHYDSDGITLGEFIDDRVQTHTHTMAHTHSGTTASPKGKVSSFYADTSVALRPFESDYGFSSPEKNGTYGNHTHTFTTGQPSSSKTGVPAQVRLLITMAGLVIQQKAKQLV